MQQHIVATWGEWDEAFQREYNQEKFDPAVNSIIVVDQQDIGVLLMKEDVETIKIERFFITPKYQNKGIGTSIMLELIQKAKDERKKLSLTVIKANTRAKQFYEKLGLQVTSEDKERYTLSTQA